MFLDINTPFEFAGSVPSHVPETSMFATPASSYTSALSNSATSSSFTEPSFGSYGAQLPPWWEGADPARLAQIFAGAPSSLGTDNYDAYGATLNRLLPHGTPAVSDLEPGLGTNEFSEQDPFAMCAQAPFSFE
jgi:hypothetical protein